MTGSPGESRRLLVVAGGHNESSLAWATAEAWLMSDPAHELVLTVRSEKAREFVEAKRSDLPDRIGVVQIDWATDDAQAQLEAHLAQKTSGSRVVAGVIHAIAGADATNFTTPAHAIAPATYLDALNVTTVSLFRLIGACRRFLIHNAGIVTFGFGEFSTVSEEYGPALSVAKIALAQAIVALAISLGREEPPARTLEIVTGLIPTYGARGVAAGISKRRGSRVSADDMARQFAADAPLATSPEGQRIAAGELAVSFIVAKMFQHTTGERIHVDGGWTTLAKSALPPVGATT